MRRGQVSFGSREVALNYRKGYIRSIPGLGVVADIAVITDLIGHSIQNTDDIERLIAANGGVAYFRDPTPDDMHGPPILIMPQKTAVNEALAADGIRGLYIHCAEERLKRDQFLLDYLRGTDDRLGDHRDLVKNHAASLRMFEKKTAIEQAWLGALKSGVPLSTAKRDKIQSCAAFVKELVTVRGKLSPPEFPNAEEGVMRAWQAVYRAKKISQKLARPADLSEWTPERTARHEAARAAVQTWLIAAEKRLEAEDAYAEFLRSGGGELRPFQASVWKARYAAYEAFANACIEALNPAWLPSPPAFIGMSKNKREADWRLDPATAALEAARAGVAVWRRFDMRPYSNILSYEPYKSAEGFRKAFRALPANIAVFESEPVLKWRDAVQNWQTVLVDENADDAEKIAAAEAVLAAQDERRAVPKPDYWSFVDEKYRIPIFMEGEESSMDVETAVYEIAVHKIAESMSIAMDIEHIYYDLVRLGREERAEGAFDQLIAVKEWQAALTDGGATEEEIRLAQDIAMSYGNLFTWEPYQVTKQKIGHPRDVHPLKFRNDSTSAW